MEERSIDVPGYLTIKQAAQMLALSPSRVYEYVEAQRLSSFRAANLLLIPAEEVQSFRRGIAGRPRKSPLVWRRSPENNEMLVTEVVAQVRPHKAARLMELLADMRTRQAHLFPGTVARYLFVSQQTPLQVRLLLIWRQSIMPDEAIRQRALEAFQEASAEVLDWSTAQEKTELVLCHT